MLNSAIERDHQHNRLIARAELLLAKTMNLSIKKMSVVEFVEQTNFGGISKVRKRRKAK